MKKKIGKILFITLTVIMLLACVGVSSSLAAETFTDGDYTYTVENGEATITDVDESISGDITIPSTLGGYSVTSIGSSAFEGCTSLTSITIPDSVTSIGYDAFAGCTSLTSITIPDSVTSIGYDAFMDCTSLTSITIPDSVTSIGSGAFTDCTSLTSITIPDSVTSIGSSAFAGCTSLTSITIPDSVASIGSYAFEGCTSLTSITIPDSVTSIGSSAFAGCTSLTSITIPNSVTSIGDYEFEGCTSLTSITIPDSVTSIGRSAFEGCTSLTSITIPDSVASIGYSAFYNTAYYNNDAKWSNGVLYIGNHLISANPDIISGAYSIKNGTKTVAGEAFMNCTSLTSITIPNSVTSIGSYAFEGCTSLTSITIPNSVTSIDSCAFWKCTSLTSITIPNSVTSIGRSAFEGCTSLTSITIPNSVTSIGSSAFEGCTSLTSITIPNSVTSIGDYEFEGCTSLTSITIPNSVTSIGYHAFAGCTSLTSITILNPKCEIYDSSYTIDSVATIIGQSQSTAQAYAEEYGRIFYNFAIIVTKPTCTENGYTTYRCTDCDYSYTDSYVAPLGHSYSSSYTVDKKATCSVAGSKSKHCTRSGCTAKTSVTAIAKLAHTYDNACDTTCNVCYATREIAHSYTTTTTKATLSANGNIKTACTVCGNVKSSKTISYPKTFTLSTTSYTYNGNVKTPTVTVKDAAGNVLKKDTDYTVTYAEGRKNAGTYNVTVKMIGNYTGTKTLTFKINPINISTCTVKLSATSLTYNGAVRTPTVTVTNSYGTKLTKDTHYTVTYAAGRKNAGTYKVTVKMIGNYTGTKTLSFKINPINISTCTVKLSATGLTYNGNVRTPVVTVTNANGVKLTKDTHYTVTYATGRKNVGTYNVKVTMKGNYTGTKTLSFKINPIDISKCTVKLSATSLTYNGNVRTPTVTVTNASGTKLTKGTSYTVTYAEGRKNVGTYKVTVKMIGNYTGTKTLTFKINPINISTCTVKLSATSLTYNGAVRTPTVTVTNSYGTKLTKDTHYTVTYASGRKNVGTYKVTVKMIGNYTGTKTLSFKINPINISTCTVKLSATSFTYNGNVKTPTVTVTNSYGTKLTKDTHYTVSYATGRKNVGTYKVTVKMIGNYTGTKTLTFKILPPKTTVSSLTAGTKSITVNLTKKTTQVTGYQIQYSTSKDFTNAKTKTLTSYSTVKTTLSGLTANKTYYVRVRTYKTVNDVKYYSGWSAYKYVKTK